MNGVLPFTDLCDRSLVCYDCLRCLGSGSDGLGSCYLDALVACDRALVLRRVVGDIAIITAEDLLVSRTLLLGRSRISLPHSDIVTASRPLCSGVTFSGQCR